MVANLATVFVKLYNLFVNITLRKTYHDACAFGTLGLSIEINGYSQNKDYYFKHLSKFRVLIKVIHFMKQTYCNYFS